MEDGQVVTPPVPIGPPVLIGPRREAFASQGSAEVESFIESLSEIDSSSQTVAQQVELIAMLERVKGAAAAAQARVTARAIDRREAVGEDSRSLSAEIALARRCSPTLADRHVGVARALAAEMPHTLAALTRGDLTERRAGILVAETACLSREHRQHIDSDLAGSMTTLGDKALAGAVRRAGAALDAAALAARASRAVASRRVSVRPAPDGMAWLSILGPMTEVIGAHAALTSWEKQRHHLPPDLPDEHWQACAAAARADTRTAAAWIADRALELLSGRASDQPQPVAANLVMTDRVLLPACFGGPGADDTAQMPGWGPVAGASARAHLEHLLTYQQGHPEISSAVTWLRRLFTDPTGHDLTQMDSTRRRFQGALRTFLQLRDPTCRVPWCDAPTRDLDHTAPARAGGPTTADNAAGLCQRHNQIKEHPGWRHRTTNTGRDGTGAHALEITTPTGRSYPAVASPIHGHGWRPPPPCDVDPDYEGDPSPWEDDAVAAQRWDWVA